MTEKSRNNLLNQNLALEDYLGDLLTPPQSAFQNKPAVDAPIKSVVHPFPKRPKQSNPEKVKPFEEKAENTDKVIEVSSPIQTPLADKESLDIIPQWGRSSFTCTSIIVDGIPMLFPSQFVQSVMPCPDQLRPVKNQPEWVLGLLMQQHGFVAVVDCECLFFGKNNSSKTENKKLTDHQILVFGDGRWGMACQRVESEQTVHSEDVRWRTDDSHRKWLAGMLKQPAAPLINPEQLFVET